MEESERGARAINYVSSQAVSNASLSCTLSLFGALMLLPAMANPIVLTIAVFMNWRAWRLGSRSLEVQRLFGVGSSYRTTAKIGYWLGGCSFMLAAGLVVLAVGSTIIQSGPTA